MKGIVRFVTTCAAFLLLASSTVTWADPQRAFDQAFPVQGNQDVYSPTPFAEPAAGKSVLPKAGERSGQCNQCYTDYNACSAAPHSRSDCTTAASPPGGSCDGHTDPSKRDRCYAEVSSCERDGYARECSAMKASCLRVCGG